MDLLLEVGAIEPRLSVISAVSNVVLAHSLRLHSGNALLASGNNSATLYLRSGIYFVQLPSHSHDNPLVFGKDLPLVPRPFGRSTLPLVEVSRFRHFLLAMVITRIPRPPHNILASSPPYIWEESAFFGSGSHTDALGIDGLRFQRSGPVRWIFVREETSD